MAEAVWAIRLDRLPLVVGIDSHGRNLFAEVQARAAVGREPSLRGWFKYLFEVARPNRTQGRDR